MTDKANGTKEGGGQSPPPSAHDLLVEMKRGNLDAADALDIHYRGEFFRKAMAKLRSHERALAVVDRLFLKVFTKIQTYDEERRGGAGWLQRIFDNEVNDEYDNALREGMLLEKLEDRYERDRGEEINPERVVLEWERVRCLLAAFARLTTEQQIAIRRYWYVPDVAATAEYGELREVKGRGQPPLAYRAALNAWHHQYHLLWDKRSDDETQHLPYDIQPRVNKERER